MVEHNDKNCAELADEVVDSMDLKTLLSIMADILYEWYIEDEQRFHSVWEMYFPEPLHG